MSLNIKNPHVHELARQAAQRTGRSQTSAVEQALEELLARLDREEDDGEAERAKTERIDRILADFDRRLAGEPLMPIESLYDENGLPA